MLNLPQESRDGLRKLSADLTALANKQTITRVRTEKSVVDLLKLVFGVSISVIVLYAGAVIVWDYTLLFDKIPLIVSLLVMCAVGLGLVSKVDEKKEDKR